MRNFCLWTQVLTIDVVVVGVLGAAVALGDRGWAGEMISRLSRATVEEGQMQEQQQHDEATNRDKTVHKVIRTD